MSANWVRAYQFSRNGAQKGYEYKEELEERGHVPVESCDAVVGEHVERPKDGINLPEASVADF